MSFCGGPAEIVFATVGLEEGANSEVTIEGGERTGLAVKTADRSAKLIGFNDAFRQWCVTQILGH